MYRDSNGIAAILDDSWPGSAQRLAAGESMKHALHDATTVWNRREYLESLLQVLHGIPFQQKTAISGAHLDLTSNIPKGKQCSDILRQDDVQEVSFIGFESNWQSVLVFFRYLQVFRLFQVFRNTTHILQNHLD